MLTSSPQSKILFSQPLTLVLRAFMTKIPEALLSGTGKPLSSHPSLPRYLKARKDGTKEFMKDHSCCSRAPFPIKRQNRFNCFTFWWSAPSSFLKLYASSTFSSASSIASEILITSTHCSCAKCKTSLDWMGGPNKKRQNQRHYNYLKMALSSNLLLRVWTPQ